MSAAADLRIAWRRLARSPGFTLAAGLTLALGLGANIATFTLTNVALLRPLPYPEADRLVVVWESKVSEGKTEEKVSAADFLDWRRQTRSFETLAAWETWGVALTGTGEPRELATVHVSPGLLPALGVTPVLGRNFLPEEEIPGRHHVVLLSHATWMQTFGGDPAVLGRSISLDGLSHRVVGVMPAGFRFPDDGNVAAWMPLAFGASELVTRAERRFNVLGRLHRGVDLETAREELATVAARLAAEHPETNSGWGVTLRLASDVAAAGSRRPLGILLGAAALVLLLACANVAHLFLIRGLDRERELALRTALGAPRGRLVRLLLMESLMVTLIGGGAGLAIAAWLVPVAVRLDPGLVPGWRTPELDGTVAITAAATLALVTLGCGLVPALRAVRTGTGQRMARPGSAGPLIAGEVALAVVLLVGVGLLLRSLDRLLRVDPGFDPERVVAATIFPSGPEYEDDARQIAFFERLVARLRALPGVTAAGAVTTLPMNPIGIDYDLPFASDGRTPARAADQPQVDFRVVEGDYFRAVGVPLLGGRVFAPTDLGGSQRVVMVNETLARRYFPGRAALGQVVWVGGRIGRALVVGVVGDVRHRGLTDRPRPELYVPLAQYPHGGMTVVARGSGELAALTRALKEQVYAIDADQPITEITTLPDLVSRSVAPRRFQLGLLAGFAGLALLLAGVGVYGVVAYAVGRRTREIGVRIALGAQASEIRRAVLGPGLRPALLGVAFGMVAAFVVTRLLREELFEVTPHDPATYLVAVLTLLLVAWAACAAPVRRAVRTDPITALRSE